MTGKQLKNAILQLAIQGKLVPQDDSDEPASVLLAQIRKEKEQLLKAGKLKKKDLETTPITDEEKPFEIPESWEWCRLIEICSFLSRGKSPSYSDAPTDYPVFAQKCNLKEGGISLEQARFLKPETIAKWQDVYHLKTDDVLVNSTGTGTVCRTRLFNESCLGKYPFTVPDSHVSVVRTVDNICSAYICYLFNTKIYQDYWEDRLAGSTNQKELYIGVLQNTIIPIPPLSEQHRIVSKIEELMPLVEEYGVAQEKLNRLNETLPEALKKSILQQAIQGKLVPQDANDEPASALLARIRKEKEQLVKAGKLKKKDLETTPITDEEKPFEIPESWEWVRLGFVINLLSGQDLTPDRYFDTEKGIPYITGASNFINGNLVISRWTDTPTSVSKKGDLLITCKGTVGAMAYNNIGDIHIARQVMAISPIEIHLSYIKVLLDFFVPELEKQAHSIIPGISRDVLLGTIIPLPPLSEQKRIVAKIEELMAMVDGMK